MIRAQRLTSRHYTPGWHLTYESEVPIAGKAAFQSSMVILPIFEHEQYLDSGRFSMFTRLTQPYTVTLQHPSVIALTEQRIDWIANYTDLPWSMRFILGEKDNFHPNTSLRVEYSFEEVEAALMFKMVFA